MTKSILNSIDMNETHIFYDHFHLKANLEKSLLCKWKIFLPTINSMFKAPSQEMLDYLLKKTINDCSGNTNYVSTLIKSMDKKTFGQYLLLIVLKELLVYVGFHGLNAITVVLKFFFNSF